jgi:DNA-binding response OmpR family regulator
MMARRLLIVDDNAEFGQALRRVAEKWGFQVEVTTRTSEFMKIYKRFDPTVIVLDIVMPDHDGIELIRWIASAGCTARVLIISGSDPLYARMAETIGKAKGLLSVKTLPKPVSLAGLSEALFGTTQCSLT